MFTVLNRQKLQTGTSRAQFSSILRQNLSYLFHPTVSKGFLRNSNSPFLILTPPPPRLPPAAHPPAVTPCCLFPLLINFHLLPILVHCCNPLCNWLCSIPDCLQPCCTLLATAPSSTQPPASPPLAQRCCTGTCTRQGWAGGSWAVLRSAEWASSGSAGSCTLQLTCHSAMSLFSQTLPSPSCSWASSHPSSSAHPLPSLWEAVLAAASQARPSSTDPGPRPLRLIAGGHVA